MVTAAGASARQHSTRYWCVENRDRQADQVNNGVGMNFGMSLARRGYDMGDVSTVVRLVERRVERYYRSGRGLDFGGGMAGADYNSSFS